MLISHYGYVNYFAELSEIPLYLNFFGRIEDSTDEEFMELLFLGKG